MKTLLLLSTLFMSTNILATNLNRVFDGLNAACETPYDVFNSKRRDVFNFTNPLVNSSQGNLAIQVDVNLFECIQDNDEFVFIFRNNLDPISYKTYDGKATITRFDTTKLVRAFSIENGIVSTGTLTLAEKGFKALLNISKSDLQENTFTGASEKGSHYIDLDFYSIRSFFHNDVDLGSSEVSSAIYRLFIDLKTKKAQF
ncbi:hypothetical protein A9Q84_13940 [Halobacteriovorax marinus]|uniref:Secreted protein n=1 Tax=Halobacteriovorax marinus TaxID=97084 RepID=A0A1Y5FFM9_9BACT|nr:hypothetical protein A9Q84_13940 [Halobacteriovorax marinus]